MSVASATRSLIDEFQSRPTVRAGSLITTVFGDAVAPRGGSVWLGSLINAMSEFGISERLVRTSVFRLSREGWFEVDQIGRRSYYSLSDSGRRKFEQATQRIYSEPVPSWSGDWSMLLLGRLDSAQKEWLRKECSWLGYAPFSSNVLAHPGPASQEIRSLLESGGLADRVVLMSARSVDIGDGSAIHELVRNSWNLADIDQRYLAFVEQFRPLLQAARKARNVDPLCAFRIRTLLIQEYRKALLRDPLLPAELLPEHWHGAVAYRLCRDLYQLVHAAADTWLGGEMETASGPLPLPEPAFFQRFGGL